MKTIITWLGIFAMLSLVAWGVIREHDARTIRDAQDRVHLVALDSAIAYLTTAKSRSDTVYVATVEHFHTTHDSVTREIGATPGDSIGKPQALAAVERVTTSCSAVIAACEARARISDALADSLRRSNVILARAHIAGAARMSLYGEALYDPLDQAAVLRTGLAARIAGPISALAEIEAEHNDSTHNIRARALIGARYTFR